MRTRLVRAAILDSYAVLAYLFGELGKDKVVSVLERAAESGETTLIGAPNWAEIRYQVERKVGLVQWTAISEKLLALPIEVLEVGRALAEVAGAIKATRKMSLADCFAVALAKARKADLYTGDPEFKSVEDEIRVVWI